MKDKVVLVTGGSSGIGRAAALAFAQKGAKMVIAARGAERGHRVAREIEAHGARALFVRADVSQAADVHGLVKTTVDCWGRLDCAFNNAAAVEEPFVPTAAFTEAQFDRVAQSEELLVVPATGDPPDTGAGAARRSNCQYLFGQRPVRCAAMGFVRGGQSGIDRVDQVRGARVRPPGCAHQCASLVAGAFETPMLEDGMNRVSGGQPGGQGRKWPDATRR